MCTGGRDTNACGTAQRSVITFLYSLVDRLHGFSVSQVFPVFATVKEPYCFYLLRLVSDYSCRNILILFVGASHGLGNWQDECLTGNLPHQ